MVLVVVFVVVDVVVVVVLVGQLSVSVPKQTLPLDQWYGTEKPAQSAWVTPSSQVTGTV